MNFISSLSIRVFMDNSLMPLLATVGAVDHDRFAWLRLTQAT
jgi:hypothetical protein